MQTIWKLLESIAIFLKAQKYKTSTLPILPVFQIKHEGGNPTNLRCEWLTPQIHMHYKILPSILWSTPKLLFPVASLCPLDTSHSRKHSVTKTPHETCPSSALGSALGHIEVTIAPRRMPSCSHLLPKWLEASSVSNFVSVSLVLLLRSREK